MSRDQIADCSATFVEDSSGVRHHLLRVGLDVSRYSRWGARSSTVPAGGDALHSSRDLSVRMVAC